MNKHYCECSKCGKEKFVTHIEMDLCDDCVESG